LWALPLAVALAASAAGGGVPNPLAANRLDSLSARYLGKPYALDCLGEGRGIDKDPVYDSKRVDCQTLVEQVMVDALTEPLGGRESAIRLIRYRNREVAFENRCHYCLPDWLKRPWPAAEITGEVGGTAVKSDERRIDLPRFLGEKGGNPRRSPEKARSFGFVYVPRAAVPGVLKRVPDGCIAVFVHQRRDLVASHLGFAFRRKEGVVLRHASQTRKRVIDEPLTAYLARAPKYVIGMAFLQPDFSRTAAR
jgi:hypothetical protein